MSNSGGKEYINLEKCSEESSSVRGEENRKRNYFKILEGVEGEEIYPLGA